jgi:hypothetical protein
MAKADYQEPGMTLAEVEAAIDRGTGLSSANSTELAKIDEAITVVGGAVTTWRSRPWWWQRATGHFQTSIATLKSSANSGAQRTSNVSTITTTSAHGFQAGQLVNVSGCTDSTFDGIWPIEASTATDDFTYNQVGADVGATVAGSGTVYVHSYPLRGIDLTGAVTSTDSAKIAWKAWAIRRVYYDEKWPLNPVLWSTMRQRIRLQQTVSASKPYQYAVDGEDPYIYVWPVASSALDIYIDFLQRHSKITNEGSTDTALIVPAEFHWPIYVQGAQWVLNHENMAEAPLSQCPGFMEGIEAMSRADPTEQDAPNPIDLFPDARVGHFPPDRKVVQWADGGYMIGDRETL